MGRKKVFDKKIVQKRVKKKKKPAPNLKTVDFRRHIGLLGRLSTERPINAREHVKKARQLVEQRKHSEFFEVVGEVLKPKFLYFSHINRTDFDGMILFLWRYSLLALRDLTEDPEELMDQTKKCNDAFKLAFSKISADAVPLAQIVRLMHNGQFQRAQALSSGLNSFTSRHIDLLKNVLNMIVDSQKASKLDVVSNASSKNEKFVTGQFDSAMQLFRQSDLYDWALSVHAAYFFDSDLLIKQLRNDLSAREQKKYNLSVHQLLASIDKSLPNAFQVKPLGLHPFSQDVSVSFDKLEMEILNDEVDEAMDGSFSDENESNNENASNDENVADHKSAARNGSKLKPKTSTFKGPVKIQGDICKTLGKQLICLLEISGANNSTGSGLECHSHQQQELWSKFRLVFKHLMTSVSQQNQEKWLSEQFDALRMTVWRKMFWQDERSKNDFVSNLWSSLYPNVNLAYNPIAAKERDKFVRMAQVLRLREELEYPEEFDKNHATAPSMAEFCCRYFPDFNDQLFDSITLPRDLRFLDEMEPVRRFHILFKFSLENSLYTSDNTLGHHRYVHALSEALLRPESEDMLSSVVRGKQMVELESRLAIERTFYERDSKQIRHIFRKEPKFAKELRLASQVSRIVTGKERLKASNRKQMLYLLGKLRLVWNYKPFDRHMQRLRGSIPRLAREYSIEEEQLRLACDLLVKYSRYPLTLKAAIRSCCACSKIAQHAQVVQMIFEAQFEQLFQTNKFRRQLL